MTEREYIDCEYAEVEQPQSWEDVPRFLAAANDKTFEVDYEAHERHVNPNGLALRDALEVFASDTDMLLERVGAMFPTYLRELKLAKAQRYFRHATRGLVSPEMVTRAIDRAMLFMKAPEVESKIDEAIDPELRRARLEEFVKYRHSLEPLRLNIDELDKALNGGGGVGLGEVLHVVGGEGGSKTSVVLHSLTDYAKRGGKCLFISLDMSPQMIEVRLLMRILECSKNAAFRHISERSPEYLRALESRREIDENLQIIGGPMTLAQLETVVLAAKVDVIGLDYITCISGFPDELSTARAVSQKVRQWRDRWAISFILLSQMSRASRQDQGKGGTGGHAIGGSSLEQLVDYEIELLSDAPMIPGDPPRLIATLRKNRNGPAPRSFQLFPFYPSIEISTRAEPVERDDKRKPIFKNKLEF